MLELIMKILFVIVFCIFNALAYGFGVCLILDYEYEIACVIFPLAIGFTILTIYLFGVIGII